MSQDLSDFVYVEAKERAFEIEIESRKLYEAKRKVYIERERRELEVKFGRKEAEKLTKYKIERSVTINESRNEVLLATNKALLKLLNKCQLTMINKTQDTGYYKDLLKQLIIQGLVKMREQNVSIRCLEDDAEMIRSLIQECGDAYIQTMKDAIDQDCTVNITVDENY